MSNRSVNTAMYG